MAVAQKTEKGDNPVAQKAFSNKTTEELSAAMTMLPAPTGRVASAQSR